MKEQQKILGWIVFLFFLSVLVSQSAMDFFSVLMCGAWVWLYWRKKAPSLLRPFGLERVWVIWVLVAAMGFVLNPMDWQYALTRVIEFKWILILYVIAEVFEFCKIDQRSERFFWGVLGFIALAKLVLFLLEIPLFSKFKYGVDSVIPGRERAGGLFVNPMTFAHSFSLFTLTALGLGVMRWKEWNQKQKVVRTALLLLSFAAIFYTYTRGVWIGILAAILLALTAWKRRAALLFAIGVLGLGYISFHYSEGLRWRVIQTRNELSGPSERKDLWRTHFEIFKDNPFFGAGYGQNTKLLPKYFEKMGVPTKTLQSHAHNQYLHLLAGTGVFGLSLYLIVWGYFFWLIKSLWKKNLDHWSRGMVLGIFLAQISFLVSGLTEANFEHSKVRFAVMLMWGMLIYLKRREVL